MVSQDQDEAVFGSESHEDDIISLSKQDQRREDCDFIEVANFAASQQIAV